MKQLKYFIPALLPLLVFGLFMIFAPQQARQTVAAPLEACTRTPTEHTEESVHMQCQPVNGNPCGMQLPVTTQTREYIYYCTWSQME